MTKPSDPKTRIRSPQAELGLDDTRRYIKELLGNEDLTYDQKQRMIDFQLRSFRKQRWTFEGIYHKVLQDDRNAWITQSVQLLLDLRQCLDNRAYRRRHNIEYAKRHNCA